MSLEGKKIGFALTGSHCTIPEVLPEVKRIVDSGADVTAIISDAVANTDTRFGKAADVRKFLEDATGKPVIDSIVNAEPIGPKKMFDCLIIAPCTGNTLSKISKGIIDSTGTMAAKAHMRNARPVVIAVSTNDGLGINATNIGALLPIKNVYFVPFGQDNPTRKPNSLVARMNEIENTVVEAMLGNQNQPILVEKWRDTEVNS